MISEDLESQLEWEMNVQNCQVVMFFVSKSENNTHTFTLSFCPGLPGDELYQKLSEDKKELAEISAKIAEYVVAAIKET